MLLSPRQSAAGGSAEKLNPGVEMATGGVFARALTIGGSSALGDRLFRLRDVLQRMVDEHPVNGLDELVAVELDGA